ncbi:MAG: hypothetical protein LBS74_10515 [Oscillospiraceae bacterium]|jgi:hypothetical protein|nr:hypothetical protein [Oscillospiraceae bacterium]
MRKFAKRIKWKKVISIFVLVTLILSMGYAILQIVIAEPGAVPSKSYNKMKSDYVLILLQCLLGIFCIFMPSMLERRFKLIIPNMMYLFFIIFLYAAIYLGEVRSFYYTVPYWDTILHTFSGAMLGALGFSVVRLLNDTHKISVDLSPLFVAFFALTFAVFMGVIWEIYEYTFDGIFGLNMQKFAIEQGDALVGRAALSDTMLDLIVDTIGAAVMSTIGYISLKEKKNWLEKLSVFKSE